MRLLEFKYGDENLDFAPVTFGDINLVVGASGAGKTKFLSALFAIAAKAAINNPQGSVLGDWRLLFEHKKRTFRWEYESKRLPSGGAEITKDIVTEIKAGEAESILINRTSDAFRFNTSDLPNSLSKSSVALNILKDEPLVQPVHDAFTRIERRNFYEDALQRAAAFEEISTHLDAGLKKKKSLDVLFGPDLSIGVRLYFLEKYFPVLYKTVCTYFQSIFPYVVSCEIKDLKHLKYNLPALPIRTSGMQMPVFTVREKNVRHPVPFQSLSSGMQKVLLIITDIMMLPGGNVYLIDEYENSLGINAINFLPQFLIDHHQKNQFILTSHHPYLINAIPIKNWFVFHRAGQDIKIKSGHELSAKYGRSKQMLFTQLMNDPFYAEGVG